MKDNTLDYWSIEDDNAIDPMPAQNTEPPSLGCTLTAMVLVILLIAAFVYIFIIL